MPPKFLYIYRFLSYKIWEMVRKRQFSDDFKGFFANLFARTFI